MKRRNLTPQENSKNINFNAEYGLRHTILREPSLVDEFYFEECQPSDDKDKSYSLCDPIFMMFNQERLSNMGVSASKAFLDSLTPQSNDLAELRQKCTDDDLFLMIKSRHLQSPAEILHWCRYINDNVDKFNSEVAKLVAEKEAADKESADKEAADRESADKETAAASSSNSSTNS